MTRRTILILTLTFLLALPADASPITPPTPWYGPPLEGWAVHYAASWDWERIAELHGLEIPVGVTPVAHWDCGMLGRSCLLQLGDGRRFVPCIVADCTQDEHVERVRGRSIVVETPFETAQRYGFVGGRARAVLWLEE